MFNLTVINIKDIKKYAIKLFILCIIGFVIAQTVPLVQQLGRKINLIDSDLLVCLDTTCETIKQTQKIDNIEKKAFTDEFFEDILKTQISSIEDYTEIEDTNYENQIEEVAINTNTPEEKKEKQNDKLELARNKSYNTSYNTRPFRIKIY